jgi:hypothetical protein
MTQARPFSLESPDYRFYSRFSAKLALLALALASTGIFAPAHSQVTTNLGTGSTSRTQVTLSNTMGVYTQLDTSPNVKATVNANVNLEPGSTVQDSFGSGDQGALKGTISITSTSANIDLQGLSTKNNYVIGPGTSFSSEVKTLHGSDCTGACAQYNGPTRGNVGAGMAHNMSLTVDQSTSSFSNTFSRSF